MQFLQHFKATFCKTVPTCCRTVVCLSVCPVCDIGVLWPNGWMDQDETWYDGRPRPRPHCVDGDPTPPHPKGHSPQLSVHLCCGQTAGWIKMPLGREVSLGPGHIVLGGDPAPPPQRGTAAPTNFRPMSVVTNGWMDQNSTWCEARTPRPRPHCVR